MKPTVHFVEPAQFVEVMIDETSEFVQLARVYALDHPRLGEQYIRTSIIIAFNKENGSFETLNTLYVPHKGEKHVHPKSLYQEHHTPGFAD